MYGGQYADTYGFVAVEFSFVLLLYSIRIGISFKTDYLNRNFEKPLNFGIKAFYQ